MEILVGLVKEGVHLLIRSLLRWVEKTKQRELGGLGTTVESYARIFVLRLQMGYHCPWRVPR